MSVSSTTVSRPCGGRTLVGRSSRVYSSSCLLRLLLIGKDYCGRRTKVKHLAWLAVAAAAAFAVVVASGWLRAGPSPEAAGPGLVPNRTATAGNQRLLIFHRIPKTGSEMMQEMGKALGRLKGYRAFVDPWPPVYFPTGEADRKFVDNFKTEILDEVGKTGGFWFFFNRLKDFSSISSSYGSMKKKA